MLPLTEPAKLSVAHRSRVATREESIRSFKRTRAGGSFRCNHALRPARPLIPPSVGAVPLSRPLRPRRSASVSRLQEIQVVNREEIAGKGWPGRKRPGLFLPHVDVPVLRRQDAERQRLSGQGYAWIGDNGARVTFASQFLAVAAFMPLSRCTWRNAATVFHRTISSFGSKPPWPSPTRVSTTGGRPARLSMRVRRSVCS